MTTRTSIQQFVSTTQPTGNVILGDKWFNPQTQKYYILNPVGGAPTWLEIPILGTDSSVNLSGNIKFGNIPDQNTYDPYFNKVDVLMHFDGDYINSAPGGGIGPGLKVGTSMGITTGIFSTGTVINPNTSASGAIKFNAVTSNYVQVGERTNPMNRTITGDYTIECWFCFDEYAPASFLNRYLFSSDRAGVSNQLYSYIYNQSTIYWGDQTTGFSASWQQGTYFQRNVWYHYALVRQGGYTNIYINGIRQNAIGSASMTAPAGGPWRIGLDTFSQTFNGRIDEFRITRDIARYTSNFQPLISHVASFPDTPYLQSIAINHSTVSTSTNTGALFVQGGIASKGDMNIAGYIRSWTQVRSPTFYGSSRLGSYQSAYSEIAFQVKNNYDQSGDYYNPVHGGLGYDPANDYVYMTNANGNTMNTLYVGAGTIGAGWYSNSSNGYFTMPGSTAFNFGAGNVYIGNEGTGLVGIRKVSSSLPASLYVYLQDGSTSAYTTPTNYERAALDWHTTPNTLTMGVQAGGTGGGKNIRITTGSLTTGSVTIIPTTVSTSTNTGALIVQGGIGTWGNIYAGGSLTAVSKSFLIDHPTKEGMNLQYGSLEGPENGVYVRGRLTDINVINLPDYWIGLVDESTITASVTPIGCSQNLWINNIANNQVIIGHTDPIDCFYTVYGERKDIGKLIVEFNK